MYITLIIIRIAAAADGCICCMHVDGKHFMVMLSVATGRVLFMASFSKLVCLKFSKLYFPILPIFLGEEDEERVMFCLNDTHFDLSPVLISSQCTTESDSVSLHRLA